MEETSTVYVIEPLGMLLLGLFAITVVVGAVVGIVFLVRGARSDGERSR